MRLPGTEGRDKALQQREEHERLLAMVRECVYWQVLNGPPVVQTQAIM